MGVGPTTETPSALYSSLDETLPPEATIPAVCGVLTVQAAGDETTTTTAAEDSEDTTTTTTSDDATPADGADTDS